METVKKNLTFLNRLKWLGILLGSFMCIFTEPRLGSIFSVALGTIAGVAFIAICERSKKNIMCDHVADDLQNALENKGFKDFVFEIRSMKPGLIIRIYMIKVGEAALTCNRIIIQRISESWYKEMVWITQLVDVNSEAEIKESRGVLDDELIEELKKMRDSFRGRKK